MQTQNKPQINIVINNEQPVTTSRNVAVNFNKQHKHVLKAIDELKAGLAEKSSNLFYDTTYTHHQNKRTFREMLMTKDGFALLAMGFSGKKAIQFKLAYIEQFNKMEEELNNQSLSKLTLPKNYASALRQLAEKVEENEQLKQQLEEPRYQQESLIMDETEVLYTTEEIALEIGYRSARTLNKVMNEERFVYFQKSNWHLYVPYKHKGYKNLSTLRKSQFWTEKGKQYIAKRFSIKQPN